PDAASRNLRADGRRAGGGSAVRDHAHHHGALLQPHVALRDRRRRSAAQARRGPPAGRREHAKLSARECEARAGDARGDLPGRDGGGAVRRDRALLRDLQLVLRPRRGGAVTIEVGIEIREVGGADVLAYRKELAQIWPDASRARIDDILPRHAARDGFRFFGAFAGRRLVGFVYGYRGATRPWWAGPGAPSA